MLYKYLEQCNKLIIYPNHKQNSMLQKNLNEIQIMASKIQQTVSKAIQQSQKQTHQSPQTHYRSNHIFTQGTTGHKYKKNNHSKSSSDHRNSENNYGHLFEQQNQMLKQQLWKEKEKGRGYRQKMREMKNYINFLEKYNDDLKKQVVLWMTRPAKKQGYSQLQVKHKFDIYRNKLNELKNQSLYEKYSNQIQPNSYTIKNIRNDNQLQNNLINNKKTQKIQHHKSYIDDDDLYKAAKTHKIQFNPKMQTYTIKNPQAQSNDEKICTSCNYLDYVSRKQQAYRKKKSQNNMNKGRKGHKVTLSTSLNLKEKGNKRCINLCKCHQEYMKTRKF